MENRTDIIVEVKGILKNIDGPYTIDTFIIYLCCRELPKTDCRGKKNEGL